MPLCTVLSAVCGGDVHLIFKGVPQQTDADKYFVIIECDADIGDMGNIVRNNGTTLYT